jgi:hypothetical protein
MNCPDCKNEMEARPEMYGFKGFYCYRCHLSVAI